MATINTYNQVLTVLEDIATRHYQINNYGVGDKWEIGTNTIMYPVLWVNPIQATMERGNNGTYASFEVNMNLKVMDLVDKGEENENDVQNDTLEILRDIVTEFSQHPYYIQSRFDIVGNVSFTPFTEQTDEDCTGWEVNIQLRTPNLRSFCGLPVSTIPDFSFPRATSDIVITDVQYVTSITNTDGNLDITNAGGVYNIDSTAITTNSASISTNAVDITNKYDKTGGVISGSATVSGSLYLRKQVYFDNAGSNLTTATSSFDLSTGNVFICTLSGSTHMEYTNPQIGTYLWEFNGQTTSTALTFDSGSFMSVDGTTPVLTATTDAVDSISGYYNGSKMVLFTANNLINLI